MHSGQKKLALLAPSSITPFKIRSGFTQPAQMDEVR